MMSATIEERRSLRAPNSLLGALVRRSDRVDIAGLLSVPVVLVAVFLLPESVRLSLAFRYTDPSPVTAYTAHFVHLELEHLVANVASYTLLVTVGYALAVLSDRRNFYGAVLVGVLISFPFALSALNLAVPRNAIGVGFSGINMGLLGLFPLLLRSFTRAQFDVPVRSESTPAVFFFAIAWIAFLVPLSGSVSAAIAGLSGLVGLAYVADCLDRSRTWIRRTVQEVLRKPGYGDLFAVAVVLYAAYPVVGFPTEPAAQGTIVNVYVHVLGFSLAFIGPYALLQAGVFDD